MVDTGTGAPFDCSIACFGKENLDTGYFIKMANLINKHKKIEENDPLYKYINNIPKNYYPPKKISDINYNNEIFKRRGIPRHQTH